MQIEALKIFCDVADLRSFSRAAKAYGLSQPAVSRVVHELERRLGVQLIDRSKRPLQLTAPGQAYYEGCRAILEQYLELEAAVARTSAQIDLSIRVAAIYSVGLGDMGQCVEHFAARYPHARVHVDYLHPDEVYERVQEGAADLGLVSFPRRSPELTILPWRQEEMVLACAPGHRFAGRRAVGLAELDGMKFVAFAEGLAIRRYVDRLLREHELAVEVVLEFDNIESIKKGIEIDAGVALLPEPVLRREVQAGSLRAIPLAGCRAVRPLGIIHRRHHRLGSAAQGFIDLLRAEGCSPCNGVPSSGNETRGPARA